MKYNKELEFAKALAREAAAGIFEMTVLETDYKQGSFDIVTSADLKTEELIRARLLEAFPDHGVLGEEHGLSSGNSEAIWHVDPIDGTASFRLGYPYWAISIGLEVAGEPVVGVVFNPTSGELFSAAKGQGAWMNQERINVSSFSELPECLFSTGFAHERGERMRRNMVRLQRIMGHALDLRRGGSAALDLCYVACGRLAFYFEEGLGSHDMAAGAIIVREAGGQVTNYSGEFVAASNPDQVLASNSHVHESVLRLLED
jgi:myo-inositol-1(or 4)-monophosphatase